MAIEIIDAIISLVPDAKCVIKGGVITVWNSEEAQPTDAEITAEQERLQAEYDNNQYQRDRAAEYPAVVDQLDDIFHNGIDGWKTTIQAVKDKYPKE